MPAPDQLGPEPLEGARACASIGQGPFTQPSRSLACRVRGVASGGRHRLERPVGATQGPCLPRVSLVFHGPMPPSHGEPCENLPQTQRGLNLPATLGRPRFCRTLHPIAAPPSHFTQVIAALVYRGVAPSSSLAARFLLSRRPIARRASFKHPPLPDIASPTFLRPRLSRRRIAYISSELPHDAGLWPFPPYAATVARRRAGPPAEYPAAVDIARARDAAASRLRKLGQVEWQYGPKKAKCESPRFSRRASPLRASVPLFPSYRPLAGSSCLLRTARLTTSPLGPE